MSEGANGETNYEGYSSNSSKGGPKMNQPEQPTIVKYIEQLNFKNKKEKDIKNKTVYQKLHKRKNWPIK